MTTEKIKDSLPALVVDGYLPDLDIRNRYSELLGIQDEGGLTYTGEWQIKNIEDLFPRWTSDFKKLKGVA